MLDQRAPLVHVTAAAPLLLTACLGIQPPRQPKLQRAAPDPAAFSGSEHGRQGRDLGWREPLHIARACSVPRLAAAANCLGGLGLHSASRASGSRSLDSPALRALP